MTEKALILHLIFQDLRLARLIHGLQAYELSVEFRLDLATAVAALMGIPRAVISDHWLDTYMTYMYKSRMYSPVDDDSLHVLAKECYTALKNIKGARARQLKINRDDD